MDMNDESLDLQDLLNEPTLESPAMPAQAIAPATNAQGAEPAPAPLSAFLHRIPVTLTLEAGSARITLQELSELHADSVVALDTMVGEPLTIKVNGTAIGKGEVVVAGETYGLKVLELNANLPSLHA
ncbi:MAG: FliM/FliN family flagellar motor switch protein [Comamonas sp.]